MKQRMVASKCMLFRNVKLEKLRVSNYPLVGRHQNFTSGPSAVPTCAAIHGLSQAAMTYLVVYVPDL